MGKFKIGDKVKFLSSQGRGIIRSFAATNVANVEDESGFEIPTLVSDLILDACDDAAGAFFCSPRENKQEEKSEAKQNFSEQDYYPSEQEEDYSEQRISSLYLNKMRDQTSEGIYLCFVPHEQRWLVYGDIDIYLINHTKHRIIYSILLADEEKGFVSEDFGTLEKAEKILVETISRERLEEWKKACVQLMFHDDEAEKVLLPVNCELKIRTNKFFTEGSFIHTAFFEEKVIMYPVCSMLTVGTFLQNTNTKKDEANEKTNKQIINKVNHNIEDSLLSRHKLDAKTAEVDLHIEELTENEGNMKPEQMLKLQLDYAVKCLNEAITENLDKIIFIHGVGQGILKKELCKELDKYKGIHYFAASMAKYGTGATEVYIGTSPTKAL